ncbi:MAG: hypothetical protein ACT4P7_18330 [Gemmatimonadaceae bacterium]
MIARQLRRASLGGPLAGLVLAGDVRAPGGQLAFAKGSVLRDEDRSRLLECPWDTLHVLELDASDVHEAAAGCRLATAVAGAGVAVGECAGGQWPIRATHRGVLRVGLEGLARVNAYPDLSVYTLYDGQVVEGGETVARAKIIPFAVPESTIASGERRAAESSPIVSVRGFQPRTVGALVQDAPRARVMERFRSVFAEKIAWFGGQLEEPIVVAPDEGSVRQGLGAMLERSLNLVVIVGSRAMDPLDPVFSALEDVGATMIRRGMPAHPGSLCWVARRTGTTIVGMPSCGVFSQATVFDLLLTWEFAGVPLDASLLAQFGHGGFLTKDMAFRFPPYRRARERGEVE